MDRYNPTFITQNFNTFNISETDYKDLIKYLQSKNIVIDPKQLAAAKPLIYNDLKVMLCKYHLGDVGYHRANNLTDNVVKQALTSLQ